MTESKTETATVNFRELDMAELEMASGGYTSEVTSYLSSFSWVALNPQPLPPKALQLSRALA